jgi:V-type H+-transporting ATPase subunit C
LFCCARSAESGISFTVRDYSADPAAEGANQEQRAKLVSDKKFVEVCRMHHPNIAFLTIIPQQEQLTQWCRQNFAEAFIAWAHLKAIRLFVESVLRYGLPINIRGITMHVRTWIRLS